MIKIRNKYLHEKNGFAKNMKIQPDTDLKIILLYYQNNYVKFSS